MVPSRHPELPFQHQLYHLSHDDRKLALVIIEAIANQRSEKTAVE